MPSPGYFQGLGGQSPWLCRQPSPSPKQVLPPINPPSVCASRPTPAASALPPLPPPAGASPLVAAAAPPRARARAAGCAASRRLPSGRRRRAAGLPPPAAPPLRATTHSTGREAAKSVERVKGLGRGRRGKRESRGGSGAAIVRRRDVRSECEC
eukprot:365633-Chlamydomonas_euryale.AAC.2